MEGGSMDRGRITYILGFLPTYVLREILELASRGYRVDVFLPDSEEISEYWMSIISSEDIGDSVSIHRTVPVHLYNCSPGALPSFFFRECVPVLLRHPLRFLRLAALALRTRSFRFFLAGVGTCRRIAPDTLIVHSHFARTVAFSGMWAAGLLGLPFTVTTHAVDIFVPRREDLVGLLLRWATGVMTISRFNRSYIAERYGEELLEKVRVTHLGLDTESLPERRPAEDGPPLVVCTASGLVEKKGVPVLLDACAFLKGMGVDFRCLVIGADRPGALLDRYRGMVREKGLEDRVEFTGTIRAGEVLSVVAGADLFVLPSVEALNGDMDGIPVSLMESMGMGVPTISTRISGIPELIEDGTSGLLVEPGDSAGLAEAMARLLSDRGLASGLAEGGRRKVREDFSVSGYVSSLLDCWSGLFPRS